MNYLDQLLRNIFNNKHNFPETNVMVFDGVDSLVVDSVNHAKEIINSVPQSRIMIFDKDLKNRLAWFAVIRENEGIDQVYDLSNNRYAFALLPEEKNLKGQVA